MYNTQYCHSGGNYLATVKYYTRWCELIARTLHALLIKGTSYKPAPAEAGLVVGDNTNNGGSSSKFIIHFNLPDTFVWHLVSNIQHLDII
jgi:hypothetical protein